MIERLLVPLDGSQLAEKILPIAAYFARALHASVHLIHVVEKNAPSQVHKQLHLTNEKEASEYLNGVKARMQFPEDSVSIHVHADEVGNVTRSIISHAEHELPSDLIIMCAHGHGGTRRFLFGSIAQQVASSGKTPVLFVNPDYEIDTGGYRCATILVPLDLTLEHESGCDFAADLAGACSSKLALLTVIPEHASGKWTQVERLLPTASSKALEAAFEQAQEYIAAKANVLQQRAIAAGGTVLRGEPAHEIVESAKQAGADLIVMGSHGAAGMDAFWEGSVAAQVYAQCLIPVILIPIDQKQSG